MKKNSEEDLNQKGIFAIINKNTDKGYIGQASQSFEKSLDIHTHCLRANTHPDKDLQAGWNKDTEFRHEFKVLEVVPEEEITDRKYLSDLRQIYLDNHNNE